MYVKAWVDYVYLFGLYDLWEFNLSLVLQLIT